MAKKDSIKIIWR